MKKTRYGAEEVPTIQRSWRSGEKVPYKKTYGLKPGESWHDAEETENQWEHYVILEGETQIPVGAAIAKELINEGATETAFIELWGGCVLVDHNLQCIGHDGKIGEIIRMVKQANNGLLGGFPDVIGIFPDGRIALREAKNIDAKDRLSTKQHLMADLLRQLFKEALDLQIVEWVFETPSK